MAYLKWVQTQRHYFKILLKFLKDIVCFFEKNIKNKKKNKATIPNLIESERKGGALSTIILLVINADDQSITKIIGIILKI